MDELQQPDLNRLENKEDEAVARSLAAALCEDDVGKFLQLYDEIPPCVSRERVSNIYNANVWDSRLASFPLRASMNL